MQCVSKNQLKFSHFICAPSLENLSLGLITVYRVKSVLSGQSKNDKIKILMTNGSLMKVESIAECSLGAFCNTSDLQ